ncbi:MAG: serine/threonine protein kinase, partial [Geodermatophilales bacterium]|nr:serine/threonine protein kinase [Geodermatophilales bacterium]
ECLAGVRPFDGASQVAIALAHINRPPPPLPAHVPPAVRLLVERALAKDPADRFPDGGAFAEAIRRVAAGGTLAAASVAPPTLPTEILGGAADGGADGRTRVIPATGPGALAAGGTAVSPGGPAAPMPPLQAPGDDWPPQGEEPSADRRGRGWIWPAAILLVLLLAGGGGWLLLKDGAGSPGGVTSRTSAPLSTSAGPTGLFLDPAFIGRPADDVQRELEAAGLVVRQEEADGGLLRELGRALDPGDVAGLRPVGQQAAPGTEVILFVASDGYTPRTSAPATTSQAPETTTTPPTTTSAPTSDTTTTPSTTTSESARGTSLSEPPLPTTVSPAAEASPTQDVQG